MIGSCSELNSSWEGRKSVLTDHRFFFVLYIDESVRASLPAYLFFSFMDLIKAIKALW